MQEADVVAILDDVVPIARTEGVDPRAADQEVVASVTPKGIVAKAANKDVTLVGAAQNNMIATVELQQVVVFELAVDQRLVHRCSCTLNKAGTHCSEEGINVDRHRIRNRLDRSVDFEDVLHRGKDICWDVRTTILDVGVADDHRRKGVVLQFADHVHPVGPAEVVEPVSVLQVFHLALEHKPKGRAQHATEGHDGFGQAADPELDIVDTGFCSGPNACSVDKVKPVIRCSFATKDQLHRCSTLVCHGGRRGDAVMSTVCGDEVHDRCGVLQVGSVVGPSLVGLEEFAPCCGIELLAGRIQRGHTGVPTTGDVQRRKVKRQTDEVVTQRAGDEFVDVGAGFTRHTARNSTCGCIGRDCTVLIVGHRVKEGRDQIGRGVDTVGVHGLDVLGQH